MSERRYCSAEMMRRVHLPWWEIIKIEAAGKFPRRLDERGEEWDADEIDAWIAAKDQCPAQM